MKTVQSLALLMAFGLISLCATAQPVAANSCGLYASAADFVHHSLTYAFDCNSQDGKLHLNDFFGGHKGYVQLKGQKHWFNKQEVYGYRDNKANYRFFKNTAYRIMDTTGFFLYYAYEQKATVKGKEMVKTDEYFFSKGAADTPEPLTIDNIEKAFPTNSKFHYAIDETCKSDKDLVAYDGFLNTYKIKYLFNQSVK